MHGISTEYGRTLCFSKPLQQEVLEFLVASRICKIDVGARSGVILESQTWLSILLTHSIGDFARFGGVGHMDSGFCRAHGT